MQSELGYWSRYHGMDHGPEVMKILDAAPHLPALVVFDLDYTIWPYFCESRTKSEIPLLYPQAKPVIEALKSKGVLMAVASRSPTADIARTFLNKSEVLPNFCVMEIYPSYKHKTDHFKKIHQKTGIPYRNMLFFDDEERNILAVSQMGVKSVLCQNGVNLNALNIGLQKFGATNQVDEDGPCPAFLSLAEMKNLAIAKPEALSLANVVSLANSIELGTDGQVRKQKKLTDFWNDGVKWTKTRKANRNNSGTE